MRAIKVYCPPGAEPPLYAFIDALDGKLKAKLLWQIFRLRNLSACELKEPHFKHFSLERYSQMCMNCVKRAKSSFESFSRCRMRMLFY